MLQLPLHHEHYRKSLLFQDGLEIRYVITVTMIAIVRGHLLLERYEQFVKNLYAEPKMTLLLAFILQKQIFPSSNGRGLCKEEEKEHKV